MNILRFRDEKATGQAAATLIAAQVLAKPDCVLGLATGSTPIPTYHALADMAKAGVVDFSRVRSFNLDEYVGLAQDHEQSYYAFMWAQLFSKINIMPANAHLPSGNAGDLKAECTRYDGLIQSVGGIDLQLLGIGLNGHIGFNEPAASFPQGTHVVDLTPSTITANRRFFASEAQVPRQAITMGVGTIMAARRIMLVACGSAKADIIAQLAHGDITPQVPASALRLHPDVTILVDEAAAAKL